jgi:hypothetical protein
MSESNIKRIVGETFLEIAEGLQTGSFGKKIKIGLTTLGSEHGIQNLVSGAELASKDSRDFEIVLIGPKVETHLEIVEVATEAEMHKKMEELIDSKYIAACVTMHYNFCIGTSTVGKVITPGFGKEMFLATTTGTASSHRVEAMVKNALYGIIAAKAMGTEDPTVGILNLDGARQVERALRELDANGYKINFGGSIRADGGTIMRGNDLLGAAADVMVLDTLTGNIMMKVFSSFTTGGSYESLGYGYGPGIGMDMERIILILSRASGVPVVANAIKYAARLAQGNLVEVAKVEVAKAKKAKLDDILKAITQDAVKPKSEVSEVVAPPKEVVTGQISGIDIMDLENAVTALWEKGIYAESGMGCTGPIAMVAEAKVQLATEVLRNAKFIG